MRVRGACTLATAAFHTIFERVAAIDATVVPHRCGRVAYRFRQSFTHYLWISSTNFLAHGLVVAEPFFGRLFDFPLWDQILGGVEDPSRGSYATVDIAHYAFRVSDGGPKSLSRDTREHCFTRNT